MATAILVPRLGWSMEEGTFAGWRKQDGERVQPGDILFVLESDKSAEDIEAIDGGILRIPADAPQEGDTVKIGQVLAYLVAEGEAAPAVGPASRAGSESAARLAAPTSASAVPAVGPASRAGPESAARLAAPTSAVPAVGPASRAGSESAARLAAPTSAAPSTSRNLAGTPRARRVARELGIDWNNLTGSGRNGRIRERDVRAAGGTTTEGRLIPHTTIRRTVAARMVAGVTEAAPVTLTTKLDATNLVALRTQFRSAATTTNDFVPSYTDLLVKLTAAALQQHPLLQAQWREDGLFVPQRIDIAFAVDTDTGLLAPVLRSVDRMTLRQVTAYSRELIEQTRAGRLSAEDMREATFTVSNLGNFGIDSFTPIIHLPQCAVLGVGRIVREPVVRGERIVPCDVLTLSLTFDHRIVDGAPAARFLQTLRNYVENPAAWLME